MLHVDVCAHAGDCANTPDAGVGMQTDAAHGTVKVEKDRRLADIKAQQRAEVCHISVTII